MADITPILQFLAGVMVLAGGIFVFVNGRLNEAKTSDQRSRIVGWTLQALSIAFSISGVAVVLLLPNVALWPLALSAVSFAFLVAEVLRQSGPVLRGSEVLTLCIIFSSFTLFGALTTSFYFTHRVLSLIDRQSNLIELQSKLIERIVKILGAQ
jgi:hypothetical protein